MFMLSSLKMGCGCDECCVRGLRLQVESAYKVLEKHHEDVRLQSSRFFRYVMVRSNSRQARGILLTK